MSSRPAVVLSTVHLQRGRARAGAECEAHEGRVLSRLERFNGAAPARARNGIQAALFTNAANALQRGRARAGAEWVA